MVTVNYLRRQRRPGPTLPLSLSNADALEVTKKLEAEIAKKFKERSYRKVILLGHSMGAVLLRKAYLHGRRACSDPKLAEDYRDSPNPATWTNKVSRIVLLAGVNRGFDLAAKRPSDMSRAKHFGIWLSAYISDLVNVGRLLKSFESGTPFIANMRYDWVEYFSKETPEVATARNPLVVVQCLGDIDDIVTPQDSKDLAAVAYAKKASFRSVTFTGTGHGDLISIRTVDKDNPEASLREHRRKQIEDALGGLSEDDNKQESEVLQKEGDDKRASEVSQVVVILHGIRDYGRWSARFRDELENDTTKVVNPRYGYFGMGPFLFGSVRGKYVKWLMDEITEIKAKYPNAKFDFVGHSNGTYLLAKALQDYDSLKMRKVIFAGSVVDSNFDWKAYPEERVSQVLNFTANRDWVVAYFPRLFGCLFRQKLFFHEQPIGGAGFDGFAKVADQIKLQ